MMSLAPQRPNFVLVWIGIVLLTFSLVSNFLADAAANRTSSADGVGEMGGRLLLEDTLPVPGLFSPTSAFTDGGDFTLSEEPLFLDSIPYVEGFETSLAGQTGSFAEDEHIDFPIELLEPADVLELRPVVTGGIVPPQPATPTTHHALDSRGVTHTQPNRAKGSSSGRKDVLQSTYGGSGHALGQAHNKLHGGLGTPGFGVRAKAKIVGAGKRNTVIVSFLVSHPTAVTQLQGHLSNRGGLNPKVVALAREYVRAVLEVSSGHNEESTADKDKPQTEDQEDSWRQDLIRLLRLHPDGLEIIAELTPEQLRELANKLDARSQKLRALVN